MAEHNIVTTSVKNKAIKAKGEAGKLKNIAQEFF